MIQNDILKNYSSGLLKDAVGNSQGCNSTSHSHSEDPSKLSNRSKKCAPLKRVYLILVNHFNKTFLPDKARANAKKE